MNVILTYLTDMLRTMLLDVDYRGKYRGDGGEDKDKGDGGVSVLLYLLKLKSHFVESLDPADPGSGDRQRRSVILETKTDTFAVKKILSLKTHILYVDQSTAETLL